MGWGRDGGGSEFGRLKWFCMSIQHRMTTHTAQGYEVGDVGRWMVRKKQVCHAQEQRRWAPTPREHGSAMQIGSQAWPLTSGGRVRVACPLGGSARHCWR